MKTLKSSKHSLARCMLVYAIVFSCWIQLAGIFRPHSNLLFQGLLFGLGWLTWTFIEYVLHRFWNHAKGAQKNNLIVQRHIHHHSHPTEIKVTGRQRLVMSLICILVTSLAIWFECYFTLLAGACMGICWFFMMHYFLHQPWASRVFPGLVHNHIIHHCKQPGQCFGISTTAWDYMFETTGKQNMVVGDKTTNFYYHKHQ